MAEKQTLINVLANNPETPANTLRIMALALVYGNTLNTLLERGVVGEGDVTGVISELGSPIYQHRDLRRFARKLGVSEEERQRVMADVLTKSRRLLRLNQEEQK